nr:NADH dehydrogenase subunit 6 [Chlamisus sp. N29]
MTIISLTMMYVSLIFSMMKHPLTMGLMLLIQTVLIAMITGMMSYNFWFSYMIFLAMIGGMLILFSYMTSLASNEKFKFSELIFLASLIFIFSSMVILLNKENLLSVFHVKTSLIMNMKPNDLFLLNKFFNNPHIKIYIMMILYLLITLVAVVKISSPNQGTLRQKF